MAITLVLGGARSGKSAYAEALVTRVADQALYLATGQALDDDMAARIELHRQGRDKCWQTLEEPLELTAMLQREARPDRPILVDCLTLWLSNLLMAERDIAAETEKLHAILAAVEGMVVLVSNEVGLGIVPDNPLARAFRDHAGRLHQTVAATADSVVFIAAGLPLFLKQPR